MISYEKLQGRIERMLEMGFLQHPNNMTWVLDLGQSTQYVIKTDFVNSAPDEDFRKMLSDVPISTPKLADHMLDRSVHLIDEVIAAHVEAQRVPKVKRREGPALQMQDVLLACGELNKRERVIVQWVLDRANEAQRPSKVLTDEVIGKLNAPVNLGNYGDLTDKERSYLPLIGEAIHEAYRAGIRYARDNGYLAAAQPLSVDKITEAIRPFIWNRSVVEDDLRECLNKLIP